MFRPHIVAEAVWSDVNETMCVGDVVTGTTGMVRWLGQVKLGNSNVKVLRW